MSNIVKLLADQIKEWVETEQKPSQEPADKKGSGVLRRGRLASKSKERKGSVSPQSRMKLQGREFLAKIVELQKDLEIQGQALTMAGNVEESSPARGRLPKTNKERETESQKQAAEALKLQIQQKREAEARAQKPVNYN